MSIWEDLTKNELCALKILVLARNESIDRVCDNVGFSRGSYFNKITGKARFKRIELNRFLQVLNITREDLVNISSSEIIKYI